MRGWTVALLFVAIWLSAGCGNDVEGAETMGAGDADLDATITEFGRALILGDVDQVVRLLAPDDRENLTPRDEEALRAAWSRPGQVELRDLGYEIVRRTPSSVVVTYSGTRCAPEVRNESPTTTASVDAGDEVSIEGSGNLVAGDVVCLDLAEAFEEQPPVEFIKVDGSWYGTLLGQR